MINNFKSCITYFCINNKHAIIIYIFHKDINEMKHEN